jgi:hypothetical protein
MTSYISRPSFCTYWSRAWKLINLPASKIDLQWLEEEFSSRICVVRQCDRDVFQVAVEPNYLSELRESQLQFDEYDPTQSLEAEKKVLGIYEATKSARERWLRQVVEVIYSKHRSEVKQAFRDLTRSKGLQRELERELLFHDILVKATLLTLQHAN